MDLAERIQQLFDNSPAEFADEHFALFDEFKQRLNAGEVRAAEKHDGEWRVNFWVKQGILLGFRMGRVENFSINNQFRFFDKHTYPLKRLTAESGVRVV
ncbi:MAG TPA: 2,3,4,5-tetrahydropyridine-2,6-dicarboxylate N-succinyltransferase, partial [Blastocatellia bacterium]